MQNFLENRRVEFALEAQKSSEAVAENAGKTVEDQAIQVAEAAAKKITQINNCGIIYTEDINTMYAMNKVHSATNTKNNECSKTMLANANSEIIRKLLLENSKYTGKGLGQMSA